MSTVIETLLCVRNVGYARVSTVDQNLDLQVDALTVAGCTKIFVEKASGTREDRPELAKALEYVREGDVLVVWRLDRLGRNLRHLLDVVHSLGEAWVQFRSLSDGIDTTTNAGRLLFTIVGAIGQFEREIIAERTNAGLAAARARGRVGGRLNRPGFHAGFLLGAAPADTARVVA